MPSFLRQPEVRLFDYQRQVCDEAARLYAPGAASLLSLPTGAGKTRTALAFALEALRAKTVESVIWLAPGGELVRQAERALAALWEDAPLLPRLEILGLVGKPTSQPNIRFGTVQMAVKRLPRLNWGSRALVIFDEAHQASARTYQRVVRTACDDGAYVVGLSATPGRSNDSETRLLVRLFGGRLITPPCLGAQPVVALRQRGVLSNLQVVAGPAAARTTPDESQLTNLLSISRCPGIIFAPSIADCYVISAALIRSGARVAVVSHHQPLAMRQSRLEALGRHDLDWLVNVELLATGIDLPTLRSVALLSKIGSPILFEQIVGRVSRGPAVGGRSDTCVIDPYCLFEEFGGISSYARYVATDW
jgi:DNA repair protein RadD